MLEKMSPELNGNQPVLPKRNKKNRKHASTSNIRQFSAIPTCNVPYMNSYCGYPSTPTFAIHPEPMSLPIYPPSYHYSSTPMYNSGFSSHGSHMSHGPHGLGTPSSNRMFPQKNYANEECMSLPVVKDEIEEEPGQRRFSDPGVPNDSDSGSENENIFHFLTHQVNVLQESNRQLMREVTELRMELNMLKQQQMHSSSFDRDYEPGMISDFIKEIRDAARIREDALLAKVKHIVEEKQFSDSQLQMASEKKHHNERLAKLEEQMKQMSFTTTSGIAAMANTSLRAALNVSHAGNVEDLSLPSTSVSLSEDNSLAHSLAANRQVCELEREVLQLRREVQDSRAKKEESDSKILQLEKRISLLNHRRESIADDKASVTSATSGASISAMSESAASTISILGSQPPAPPQRITGTSLVSSSSMHQPSQHSYFNHSTQKIMQVGPVTDL